MRKLLGVLIGTAIGLAVVAGLAKLNLYLFPWPAFDWQSPQAWGTALAAAPLAAHALVAGSWAIATLVGGLIAVRAAGWSTAGWMVAVLMAFAGVVGALFVPQPLWMQIVAVVTPFAAGLVVAGAA
ncbi:hypothetical protein OF829_05645 [Sphingomonas sp. LB-2]|uniref:hypothetical protein n=1 Tax=Sphingomonas caeni TaxID=2984949 RepID=UPI0022318DF1|nr:hypothetical protein [Sphingomonas caeni]MCW3846714.1 hypothetical protein [Sphingomonas caeni]